ncbi:DUF11 domain-containing protein [Nonomuraea sp. NPDC050556]|uniref:DUF11 domain-containing protein n=1 Tax=Nonomuraea sp. NPDC050556 TaxID=3364369 RepID=UPI0037ACD900
MRKHRRPRGAWALAVMLAGAAVLVPAATQAKTSGGLEIAHRLLPKPSSQRRAGVSKAKADGDLIAGTEAIYEIVVTNKGPSVAKKAVVTDDLNEWLTFVSSDPAGCTAVGQKLTCVAGDIAVGASVTFRVKVMVKADTPKDTEIANVSSVKADTPDGTPTNDSSTAGPTKVKTSADVKIEKKAPAELQKGARADYTITVTNDGPSDAQAVKVKDTLDQYLTFVSNGAGATCAAAGQDVTCDVGKLGVGKSVTFTIKVQVADPVPAAYAIKNSATVSSTTDDPNTANNTAGPDAGLVPKEPNADLEIKKTGPFAP